MKILVCIKAVPEPEHAIGVRNGSPEIRVDDTAEMRMNRFDEFAVEEAVLIKETFSETVVDAITVGPENARKALKRAIGMGVDSGTHIVSDYPTSCDAAAVSSFIAEVAGKNNYSLILCGIMSEDMMQFSVGPMLAQRLSIPWATSVIKKTIKKNNQTIHIERELEGGVKAIVDIRLPALLTVQSGINEPRYPSLSNLLRANQSRINVISESAIQTTASSCRIEGYSYPEKNREALVIEGSSEEKAKNLLRILKNKSLI